jgi:dUTP pyrophosphatase
VVVKEDGSGVKYNTSDSYEIYNIGDKCGQLMIIPYPQIEYEFVEELSTSERGADGFGSTGK